MAPYVFMAKEPITKETILNSMLYFDNINTILLNELKVAKKYLEKNCADDEKAKKLIEHYNIVILTAETQKAAIHKNPFQNRKKGEKNGR